MRKKALNLRVVRTAKDLVTESVDDPGPGGACHRYRIRTKTKGRNTVTVAQFIQFQKGPVEEVGVNGLHNEDLIAVVIDRLEAFQTGSLPCHENAMAITNLKEAMFQLHLRTRDRRDRGVEGYSKE